MAFRYRYLESGRLRVRSFTTAREAFDSACEDLVGERTAPLEILEGDSVLYEAVDIYGLCDQWAEWRQGTSRLHPLDQ